MCSMAHVPLDRRRQHDCNNSYSPFFCLSNNILQCHRVVNHVKRVQNRVVREQNPHVFADVGQLQSKLSLYRAISSQHGAKQFAKPRNMDTKPSKSMNLRVEHLFAFVKKHRNISRALSRANSFLAQLLLLVIISQRITNTRRGLIRASRYVTHLKSKFFFLQ